MNPARLETVPFIVGRSAGGGAAAGAITGNPGAGALGGFAGFVTFAIASGQLQAAIDAGRARSGNEADAAIAASATRAAQPTEVGSVMEELTMKLTVPERLQTLIGYGKAYAQFDHSIAMAGALVVSEAVGLGTAVIGAAGVVAGFGMLTNPLAASTGATMIVGGGAAAYTGYRIMRDAPQWFAEAEHAS